MGTLTLNWGKFRPVIQICWVLAWPRLPSFGNERSIVTLPYTSCYCYFSLEFLSLSSGSNAQGLFNVLKKKYLRKGKKLKDAKRFGTSVDVVEKAERLFRPYSFLSWLDNHVQACEGRTNLPRNGAQEEVEIDAMATAENKPDDEEVE